MAYHQYPFFSTLDYCSLLSLLEESNIKYPRNASLLTMTRKNQVELLSVLWFLAQ
jgi:hypothetical protein